MKHHMMMIFCLAALFLCSCTAAQQSAGTNGAPKSPAPKKIKTGLYVDFGSQGAGLIRWALLLKNSPQIELRLLEGCDLVADRLGDLQLIVMPGGSSKLQWDSMQHGKGGANLRKFVANGGCYFGTCAGMSLILNEKNRVPMLPYVQTDGYTGGMTARIRLNEEGQKLLALPVDLKMRYHIGPIVRPGTKPIDKVSVKELGHFNCDLCQKGKIVRSMYGTPAILFATFDNGRIFVTNCHPEIYTSSLPFIVAGIKLLTGRAIEFIYSTRRGPLLRVAFLCSGLGGRKPVENLFALDARNDVDVFPVTGEEIEQGALEHADMLFVTSFYPDNEKLFAAKGFGKAIKTFVAHGGRIVRSVVEVK